MIKTKEDLKYYLQEDKKRYRNSNGDVDSIFRRISGSEQCLIWKVVKSVRYLEYYQNNKHKVKLSLLFHYQNIRHHFIMRKTGIYIFPNCFGPGLYIPHIGNIHVSGVAKIGKNCCLRPGVLIVSNLGMSNRKIRQITIGDNVEFSEGCKILCKKIGNNVTVGPNAVVIKSIPDNTTAYAPECKFLTKEE